jgi:predicted ATPase
VNRIRLRIAQAESDTVQKLTGIYFVELVGGAASFRLVKANQYGAISDWPKGFFDEGHIQAQKIMEAAMMKRRASQSER